MPSLDKREESLIIDLVSGKVSDYEFYREMGVAIGEGSAAALAMLERALQEHDSKGVEYGLYLAYHFGIAASQLDVLSSLALEPWHSRHEDVIRALAELKDPKSVDVIFRAALAKFDYRDYDDASSLGVKCVHALRTIETKEAIARLGELREKGDLVLKSKADAQMRKISREGKTAEARRLATEAIASGGVVE